MFDVIVKQVGPKGKVAPESAVGGPLTLVRDGGEIELDVPNRRLTLRVSDEELARRRAPCHRPAVLAAWRTVCR